MDNIDKELNLLLSPLRENLENELQLKRWHLAVQRELKHFHQKAQKPRLLQFSKIAASFLIGIAIGGLLFFSGKDKNEHQTGRFVMNMQPNATIEYIYAKSP